MGGLTTRVEGEGTAGFLQLASDRCISDPRIRGGNEPDGDLAQCWLICRPWRVFKASAWSSDITVALPRCRETPGHKNCLTVRPRDGESVNRSPFILTGGHFPD